MLLINGITSKLSSRPPGLTLTSRTSFFRLLAKTWQLFWKISRMLKTNGPLEIITAQARPWATLRRLPLPPGGTPQWLISFSDDSPLPRDYRWLRCIYCSWKVAAFPDADDARAPALSKSQTHVNWSNAILDHYCKNLSTILASQSLFVYIYQHLLLWYIKLDL